MAAAYSMDLRSRVLKDSDAGLSSKELAERYHVSRAWVDALKQRRRERGSVAPLKQTKFRRRALAATEADRLAMLVAARPDATLAELRDALRTSAGLTTIWRALNQLDFTLKKTSTLTSNGGPTSPLSVAAGGTGSRSAMRGSMLGLVKRLAVDRRAAQELGVVDAEDIEHLQRTATKELAEQQ